ncbi:hypothetical protein MGMO_138c00100 [Methyloglobulus morosus KoM1]|uniref:FecR protein domain-containing protein n=1 Tax=Methyloglobulus morosus KoM1 TaxID=1116472 RepID=V5BSL7_9GAMM|nr:FecR domain-containing protein [Methyloglobulus morosus]ESS69172.1 hypothetical protein MGMO_138c00100 [Methyloglobulus morosus KoM1]
MIRWGTLTVRQGAGRIILLTLLLFSSEGFSSTERIGLVKTLEPSATIVRKGVEVSLKVGSEIYEGDTILTDSDGTIGITFSDGSMLTAGSSSKVIIDNYLFNLTEKKLTFLSQVLKGSVTFMSGAINKLAPGSVRFKTPTATLGLRGTKIIIEVD